MSDPSPPPTNQFRFRFSLRTLMLGTVLLSILAAWFGGEWNRVRRQRAIVQQLNANGAPVYWDYQRAGESIDIAAPPPGSRWMRALLGDDAYAYADTTYLHGANTETDASLKMLPNLPRLQGLIVGGPHVSDESLELVARNPRLTSLCILDAKVSAAGIARLSRLARLTELQLSGSEIDDETLRGLEHLSHLEIMKIDNTSVTNAGLVHLRYLPQLRSLHLDNAAVSDAGLASLETLSQLQQLSLGPNISQVAAAQLHERLPKCTIRGFNRFGLQQFHLPAGE